MLTLLFFSCDCPCSAQNTIFYDLSTCALLIWSFLVMLMWTILIFDTSSFFSALDEKFPSIRGYFYLLFSPSVIVSVIIACAEPSHHTWEMSEPSYQHLCYLNLFRRAFLALLQALMAILWLGSGLKVVLFLWKMN